MKVAKRRLTAAMLVACLAVGLVACSSDTADDSTDDTTEDSST